MTTIISLMLLTLVLLVTSVAGLAFLFNTLNKKLTALNKEVNTQIQTLDEQMKVLYERVDKNDERIGTIVGWCETLRENQDTLQSDLQKLYYGTKKEIKSVKQQQSDSEKKESV